ncbi:MAG: hypothetical protein M3440_06940 [Chloroflexota bacterium]|nr:hypothetical protein [Chloroflexota bacterium]
MVYGTHSVLDALAASQQTIAAFGEDNAFTAIDVALAAHNAIQADLVDGLVERTTDKLRRYGGLAEMTMDELDEFGRADAQKITAGSNVGFPLRLYGASLQWTRKFMQNTTGVELAASVSALMTADTRLVNRELKRALFKPTNNLTYTDRLVDNVVLPLRALVNADSEPVPVGPNGEAYNAATHTHYLGTATLTASDISGLLATVSEHYNLPGARLYINAAQEAAVRAFTSNFYPYTTTLIANNTAGLVAQGTADTGNLGERAIGVWSPYDAIVSVKPWIPANYMFAFVDGAPEPLVWRTRNGGGALELVADDELHPLRAKSYEREFGIGVWSRTNGAALQTNGATYTMPTIN